MTLLLLHIILSIIFFAYELNKIKKYVFTLTENYLKFLNQISNNPNGAPPKKLKPIKNKNIEKPKNIRSEGMQNTHQLQNIKNKKEPKLKEITTQIRDKRPKNVKYNAKLRKVGAKNTSKLLTNTKLKNNSKDNLILSKNLKFKNISRLKKANEKFKKSEQLDSLNTINPINEKFFNEFLATSFEDMEFDDAIVKDNRKFCEFFYETLKEKQRIANTFCAVDILKTRTMKIIIFILDIILYLIVNGLFFSENYVSEVYNLEGEEGFFDFVPRSINRFVYTTMVSLIVGFIVGCFFFEEKKIKGIFIREKENKITLKGEIVSLLREMPSSSA